MSDSQMSTDMVVRVRRQVFAVIGALNKLVDILGDNGKEMKQLPLLVAATPSVSEPIDMPVIVKTVDQELHVCRDWVRNRIHIDEVLEKHEIDRKQLLEILKKHDCPYASDKIMPRLTSKVERKVIECYSTGMLFDDIEKVVGTTKHTVDFILARFQIKRRNRSYEKRMSRITCMLKMQEEDKMDMEEIANALCLLPMRTKQDLADGRRLKKWGLL